MYLFAHDPGGLEVGSASAILTGLPWAALGCFSWLLTPGPGPQEKSPGACCYQTEGNRSGDFYSDSDVPHVCIKAPGQDPRPWGRKCVPPAGRHGEGKEGTLLVTIVQSTRDDCSHTGAISLSGMHHFN